MTEQPPQQPHVPQQPAYPPPPPGHGPPAPGYGPPPPGYPPYVPAYALNPPNNGLAIASMILGILGFFLLFIIGPILALVFGYISRGQIDRSEGRQGGRGFAVAGIVMGWAGIAWNILIIGFYVWFFVYFFSTFGPGSEFYENFPTPTFGD